MSLENEEIIGEAEANVVNETKKTKKVKGGMRPVLKNDKTIVTNGKRYELKKGQELPSELKNFESSLKSINLI